MFQTATDLLVVSEPEAHQEWRAAITSGLTSLPKIEYSSQAIAFGMNAAVIAVGNNLNDVILVAGQLGKGRVVVATHTKYGENFKDQNGSDLPISILQKNIKSWATRGAYQNPSNVMQARSFLQQTDSSLLDPVKIIYYREKVEDWTEEDRTKIYNFVQSGGALFVATTPWNWSQIKQSKNFNEMLTYKTLLAAGIALTQNVIWDQDIIQFDKVAHLSHLGIQVDIALSPQSNQFNYAKTCEAMKQAQFLNAEIIYKFQQRIEAWLTIEQITYISPSQQMPTSSPYQKVRLQCYQQFFLNGDFDTIAPNHQQYPGAVDKSASNFEYLTRDFTLTAPGFQEFHHTGLYAVAGQAITVQVLSDLPSATWTVYIGFHFDNDFDHQSWVRWPVIYTKRDLAKITTFSCGFGGLIVLQSPKGNNQTIKIKVSNAIEAPWYDSQDAHSVSDWERRKTAPGAWGCAQGKWVGFFMPRASFEKVDPLQILDTYDKIYVQYHALRGTKPESQRKIYVIADLDPQLGYMHSGYPIATSMDVATPSYQLFYFNYAALTTLGHWGIFHEIGHNMQREWWTTQGTVEVTVNIFTLKAYHVVLGQTPKYTSWLADNKKLAQSYLQNPNYSTWRNQAFIALFIYAQVIEDYGWDSMRNVFNSYETEDPTTFPTTEQGIMDLFWSKYSLEVKTDLSALLNKWAVPFTADFTQKVTGLPPYVEKVNLFAPL